MVDLQNVADIINAYIFYVLFVKFRGIDSFKFNRKKLVRAYVLIVIQIYDAAHSATLGPVVPSIFYISWAYKYLRFMKPSYKPHWHHLHLPG